MTAEEKAIELMDKFNPHALDDANDRARSGEVNAKQCALIAVELHLEEISKMKLIFSDREIHLKFWQNVKTAILNL